MGRKPICSADFLLSARASLSLWGKGRPRVPEGGAEEGTGVGPSLVSRMSGVDGTRMRRARPPANCRGLLQVSREGVLSLEPASGPPSPVPQGSHSLKAAVYPGLGLLPSGMKTCHLSLDTGHSPSRSIQQMYLFNKYLLTAYSTRQCSRR